VEFPEARIYEETLNILLYETPRVPDNSLLEATSQNRSQASRGEDEDGNYELRERVRRIHTSVLLKTKIQMLRPKNHTEICDYATKRWSIFFFLECPELRHKFWLAGSLSLKQSQLDISLSYATEDGEHFPFCRSGTIAKDYKLKPLDAMCLGKSLTGQLPAFLQAFLGGKIVPAKTKQEMLELEIGRLIHADSKWKLLVASEATEGCGVVLRGIAEIIFDGTEDGTSIFSSLQLSFQSRTGLFYMRC
ncbi:putative BTB-POZ domain-containing adapter for CUL3-mediated RhoA degradation protein, partial [Naja naja]